MLTCLRVVVSNVCSRVRVCSGCGVAAALCCAVQAVVAALGTFLSVSLSVCLCMSCFVLLYLFM